MTVTMTDRPTPLPEIESAVTYARHIKALKGVLRLSAGRVMLVSQDGTEEFNVAVEDIWRVVWRHGVWLRIYTPDKRRFFGSPWALIFDTDNGSHSPAARPGMGVWNLLAQNRLFERAENKMRPWLDLFEARGVLVRGFNMKLFYNLLYLGFYLFVLGMLIWLLVR